MSNQDVRKTQISIKVNGLTKTFDNELIVRNFSHHFVEASKTAITGANGSGKSTLLKLLAGIMLPNNGSIEYIQNNASISPELWFQNGSFCAPAQELIEEFTLNEILDFHLRFRDFLPSLSKTSFLDLIYMQGDQHKKIGLFSSGMKQRLKLGLTLFTDSHIIFLDEPTSNLDEKGINWYQEQIKKFTHNRLLIIASNQKNEYDFCDQIIKMSDYKST